MSKDNYDAWKIKAKDFPSTKNSAEQTKFIAKYGVLAPSVHNSQPWIFECNDLSITIKPDYSRRLTQADPSDKYLYMSIGGCVESINIAASYFGYASSYVINRDNSVAITLKKTIFKKENIHPDEIVKRFSNKYPYQTKKVPEETLNSVLALMNYSSAKLVFVQDDSLKTDIIDMHINAAKKTLLNREFTKELVSMLKPNNSKSYIGMPGFVSGMNSFQSYVAPKVVRVFPQILSLSVESRERELLKKSAGFGVIYTTKNSISSMIEAGALYQKASILLGKQKVNNAMLAAIVMNDTERSRLKESLNITGTPFLLFRFGYSTSNKIIHTPRENL